jgi:hypothetical protein
MLKNDWNVLAYLWSYYCFLCLKVYITAGYMASLTADAIEVIDLDTMTFDTLKNNGNFWYINFFKLQLF